MNLLAKLYGGSSRDEHLLLNLSVTAAMTGVAIAWLKHGIPFALAAPLGCLLMEHWASPDRDLQENRVAKGYWEWYGRRVKHRSKWSHSLLIGTPLRLLYGFWFALPCLVVFPWWSLAFVVGAIASDCAHYLLDLNKDWGVREAIFGRR